MKNLMEPSKLKNWLIPKASESQGRSFLWWYHATNLHNLNIEWPVPKNTRVLGLLVMNTLACGHIPSVEFLFLSGK